MTTSSGARSATPDAAIPDSRRERSQGDDRRRKASGEQDPKHSGGSDGLSQHSRTLVKRLERALVQLDDNVARAAQQMATFARIKSDHVALAQKSRTDEKQLKNARQQVRELNKANVEAEKTLIAVMTSVQGIVARHTADFDHPPNAHHGGNPNKRNAEGSDGE